MKGIRLYCRSVSANLRRHMSAVPVCKPASRGSGSGRFQKWHIFVLLGSASFGCSSGPAFDPDKAKPVRQHVAESDIEAIESGDPVQVPAVFQCSDRIDEVFGCMATNSHIDKLLGHRIQIEGDATQVSRKLPPALVGSNATNPFKIFLCDARLVSWPSNVIGRKVQAVGCVCKVWYPKYPKKPSKDWQNTMDARPSGWMYEMHDVDWAVCNGD